MPDGKKKYVPMSVEEFSKQSKGKPDKGTVTFYDLNGEPIGEQKPEKKSWLESLFNSQTYAPKDGLSREKILTGGGASFSGSPTNIPTGQAGVKNLVEKGGGYNPMSVVKSSAEGIASGIGRLGESVEAAKSGDILGAILGGASGAVQTGFGALTPAIPALGAFTYGTNVASEVLPEKVVSYATAPVSTGLKDAGVEPESLAGKSAAELGDLAANILVAKGISKVAGKGKAPVETPVEFDPTVDKIVADKLNPKNAQVDVRQAMTPKPEEQLQRGEYKPVIEKQTGNRVAPKEAEQRLQGELKAAEQKSQQGKPVNPVKKFDYEVPQSDFIKEVERVNGKLKDVDIETVKMEHEAVVKQALKKGKVVPEEVLKDYPDLQPKEVKGQTSILDINVPKLQEELKTLKSKSGDLARRGDLVARPEKLKEINAEYQKNEARIAQIESQLSDFNQTRKYFGDQVFSGEELNEPAFGFKLKDPEGEYYPIREEGSQYLAIDKNGKWVIKNKKDKNKPFLDGVEIVRDFDQNDKVIADIIGERYGKNNTNNNLEAVKDMLSRGKSTEEISKVLDIPKGEVESYAKEVKPESGEVEFPLERVASAYSGLHLSPSNSAKAEKGVFEKATEELKSEITKYIPDIPEDKLNSTVKKFQEDYLKAREMVWKRADNAYSSSAAGSSNFNTKQANQRGSSLDKAELEFDKWLKDESSRIESELGIDQIKAEKKAASDTKKAEAKERAKEKIVNYWDKLKPGDEINVGGNAPVKIAKKNKFSVETESGSKYTLKELYGIDHKEAQGILNEVVRKESSKTEETKPEGKPDVIPESNTAQTPEKVIPVREAPRKRIISEESYQQARENILKKTQNLNSGVDPTILKDYAVVGAYHFENIVKQGIREADRFRYWVKDMVKEYGEEIRPQLRKIWDEISGNESIKSVMESDRKRKLSEIQNKGKEISDDIYTKNRELTEKNSSPKAKIISIVKTGNDNIKKGLKNAFVPISSALYDIHPEFKQTLRKFELNTGRNTIRRHNEIIPFLDKATKMNKSDIMDFDLARKNGDAVKINEIVKRYGMENEYRQIRNILDELYTESNKVGYEVNYRQNYHPRMIKDFKGFVKYFEGREDWNKFQQLIDERQMKLGRDLTFEEKATVINNALRGYNPGVGLSKTGQMKNRVLDTIDGEINQFYYDANESLVRYIDQTTEAIEARRFFGKGDLGDLDNSIGAYVLDATSKKKLTVEQANELTDILKARFKNARMNPALNTVKNISYIASLGSPTSAITQIGDLAIPLYRTGIRNTLKALGKGIAGENKVKLTDIGVMTDKIAQEFADKSRRSQAVRAIFKATGFEYIDKLGKETLVNSLYEKYKKQSQNPNKEFTDRVKKQFGDESGKVIDELKSGELTDNVKLLLFNELLDTQPIALSEMPKAYLKTGNGKIFYMLKTFAIRRIDYFRNETFKLMKTDPKQGIANLVKLTTAIMLMDASADELKDLLLGRQTKLSDRVVDNMLRMMGFNKYSVAQANRQGVGRAIAESILPPTDFIDDIYKDVRDLASGNKVKYNTLKDIPVVGKVAYNQFVKDNTQKRKSAKRISTN